MCVFACILRIYLCVCLCVLYIYIYIYTCVCVFLFIYMWVCICLCVCVCLFIYIYIYIYIYTIYIYIYIYIYVCVYVCIYIYIYIYIYTIYIYIYMGLCVCVCIYLISHMLNTWWYLKISAKIFYFLKNTRKSNNLTRFRMFMNLFSKKSLSILAIWWPWMSIIQTLFSYIGFKTTFKSYSVHRVYYVLQESYNSYLTVFSLEKL